MKRASKKLRVILLLLAILAFLIFILQGSYKIISIKPLWGSVILADKGNLTIKNWFDGDYQQQEEKYLNDNFGFRSFFVRMNNQIEFSLFDKAKANGVIIGKDMYLYEENYIRAYNGTDFIGVDSIRHRLQKVKILQDTLSKYNKDVIVVFAAGKGSFYPEFFPDNYKVPRGTTNYEYYIKEAKDLGLNYIDFNKFFVDNKFTSKYKLYPKQGIHWSFYGMCIASDSIIKYIEFKRKIDMPNIYWNDIEIDYTRKDDYDIGNGLNLLFKLKREKMGYPKVLIESDSGKIKPSVLVVSDSFYWGLYNLGIWKTFSSNHFWFYNQQIYSPVLCETMEVSQVNLRNEIMNHDVIIILATEATLPNLGWGFIESAYNEIKTSKLSRN
ncbi:MAG: hypothetical protein HOO91_05625 [Bacteroidales bacterium]|nr:hypothetical protein [Bacteroidales bacterium]